MQGDTANKRFEICLPRVKSMLTTLVRQLGFGEDFEHLLMDAQDRWITLFEYYENDNQYLSFQFIVMKNRIRKMKKDDWRYKKMHVTDPKAIAGHFKLGITAEHRSSKELSQSAVLAEVSDGSLREKDQYEVLQQKELIERIKKNLENSLHQQVFMGIVEGKSIREIAEECNFSVCHISTVRNKYVWPMVKLIMDIPDKKYNLLTDSGRIYCR